MSSSGLIRLVAFCGLALSIQATVPTPETPTPETTAPETTAPETTAPETIGPEAVKKWLVSLKFEVNLTSNSEGATGLRLVTELERLFPNATFEFETACVTRVGGTAELCPTTAPETIAPETTAPETTAPETTAPSTAPETTAPETTAPETTAPETTAPETTAPSTAPETTSPETTAPETTAPSTAPETTAPETTAPETTAPETTAPETTAPSTAPETTAPETIAPPLGLDSREANVQQATTDLWVFFFSVAQDRVSAASVQTVVAASAVSIAAVVSPTATLAGVVVVELDTPAPPTDDDDDLSRSAIAGIVVGCVLCIACAVAIGVAFLKKSGTPPASGPEYETEPTGGHTV